MDSRERTFLTLGHQQPDRVPVDFWASASTASKIQRATGLTLGQFLDRMDVDLRYIEGPSYKGPPMAVPGGAAEVDIWGVPRAGVSLSLNDGTGLFTETYSEVVHYPLRDCRTVEQILAYPRWPSADWFDYSQIESQCERIREAGRVCVFMGDRLNRLAQLKPAMYLRGAERILTDLVDAPATVLAIFEKICGFYLEYGRRVLESARGNLDILCTGDDFGAQGGPLISPVMWAQFVRPGFQAFIELGKAYGVRVMHHTCGSVFELVEPMIDCGLDILQSLQPEAANMVPRTLKQRFGGRISFHGGVSIQNVLPRRTPEDVRSHVRALLEAMAPGGGFIACTSHNIQADTPMANIEGLFQAYRDFGGYGGSA